MKAWWPWLLVGCVDPTPAPSHDDGIDTGWFEDDDALGCGGRVLGSAPEDGSSGWIVHDPLTVQLARGEGLEEAEVVLRTASGRAVPHVLTLQPDHASLLVRPDAPLSPSTAYDLAVQTCTARQVISFVTSSWGDPLTVPRASLRGRTWTLDLASATWRAPAGLAPLYRANVEGPVLVGVQWADEAWLDLIGTQGIVSGAGIEQDVGAATWALPDADFSRAPRFRSEAPRVVLEVLGVSLPVEDFVLEATFSSDGARLGDGILRGRMDVREAGALLGPGVEASAVCDLAENSGLACVPCDDGDVACLDADLRGIEGQDVAGLRLVPVAGE